MPATIFRYFFQTPPEKFLLDPQDLSLSCDPVGFAIFAIPFAYAAAVKEERMRA
jgi:hypothetical protein